MTNIFEEFDSCSKCSIYPHEELKDELLDCKNLVNHFLEKHYNSGNIQSLKNAFVSCKRKGCRDYIQSLYERTAEYLDSDFKNKFLIEFSQRCWEMQICNYLLCNGEKIYPRSQKEGPDFITDDSYYECVCVGEGKNNNRIPLMGPAMEEVNKESVELRISQGFIDKRDKFKTYESKSLLEDNKKRCIAINYWCDGYAFGHGGIQVKDIFLNKEKVVIKNNHEKTKIHMGYLADKDCPIDSVLLSEKSPYLMRSKEDFFALNKTLESRKTRA
jgi:hypothetical protein